MMKTKVFLIVYWVVHTVTHISRFNQICLLPRKYLRSGFKDQWKNQWTGLPLSPQGRRISKAYMWGVVGGRGSERK